MALSSSTTSNWSSCISRVLIVLFLLTSVGCRQCQAAGSINYADALGKSLLFLEAQRSGKLPSTQRVTWRGDSGLQDGHAQGVDLPGGYYDAGDHVKYGFPMAFTITLLAWSVVEYGSSGLSNSGQLQNALDAIRWGTDYFIKAHPQPNVLWSEVGDGDSDHACWERAEDMTTSRQAYSIDSTHPGSDQAGEAAAAMAAASMAFHSADPTYSQTLLQHARQLFTFADSFQGKYDDSIPNIKNYYASVSGYKDELLWAALWLHKATGEDEYLQYVVSKGVSMGGTAWMMKEFSWDVKYAGVQIMASLLLLQGRAGAHADALMQYRPGAQFYLCAQLQKNASSDNVQRTPGGLLFTRQWNNLQYVAASGLLLSIYSDALVAAKQQLQCPAGAVAGAELLNLARAQADYILGQNPKKMSYLVGYGASYPQHVHHRGASIASIKSSPAQVTCRGGYNDWYNRAAPNPNVLVGALVGGPDEQDNYEDNRKRFDQSEATTTSIGPLVGLLARLAGEAHPRQEEETKPWRRALLVH